MGFAIANNANPASVRTLLHRPNAIPKHLRCFTPMQIGQLRSRLWSLGPKQVYWTCPCFRFFLGTEFNKGTLFDLIPADEIVDTSELKEELLKAAEEAKQFTRRELRLKVLPKYFCRFKISDINKAVTELLKEQKLHSSTGKSRINDTVHLSTLPSKNEV